MKPDSPHEVLWKHGLIDDEGEPNEDAVFEIALAVFCDIVERIRQDCYTTEQIKQIIRECESSDDWSNLYFFLSGYYTRNPQAEINNTVWILLNDEMSFFVFRYYITQMVEIIDEVLSPECEAL